MFKQIIFIVLSLMTTVSQSRAADFEAALGKSSNTYSAAWAIGFTGLMGAADDWRWHAGFAALGAPKIPDQAGLAASWDDTVLAGAGPGPFYWQQSKTIKELYLTAAPEWRAKGWTYSIEFGAALYHPLWQEDLPRGAAVTSHKSRVNVTPVVGFSIGQGMLSAVVLAQNITEYGDWEGSAPPAHTATLLLRWRL